MQEGNENALGGRVARLSDDMINFAEEPREVIIVDENGTPLKANDNQRRFFEASWMHKYNGKYYFSYSTGDTHNRCYAIGDNPYGPCTYQCVILTSVIGWTTHHSIVEFKDTWYLFHQDSVPSGRKTWLRSLRVKEIEYDKDVKIKTIEDLDQRVVRIIYEDLQKQAEPVVIEILPDHPTPCFTRTNTNNPVPFLIYKPGEEPDNVVCFDEYSVENVKYGILEQDEFIKALI